MILCCQCPLFSLSPTLWNPNWCSHYSKYIVTPTVYHRFHLPIVCSFHESSAPLVEERPTGVHKILKGNFAEFFCNSCCSGTGAGLGTNIYELPGAKKRLPLVRLCTFVHKLISVCFSVPGRVCLHAFPAIGETFRITRWRLALFVGSAVFFKAKR